MRMRASLRERRRQVIYVVPNLLTTGNLFCGLYAIMAVFGANYVKAAIDRKSTRLNSSHIQKSRMPSSA